MFDDKTRTIERISRGKRNDWFFFLFFTRSRAALFFLCISKWNNSSTRNSYFEMNEEQQTNTSKHQIHTQRHVTRPISSPFDRLHFNLAAPIICFDSARRLCIWDSGIEYSDFVATYTLSMTIFFLLFACRCRCFILARRRRRETLSFVRFSKFSLPDDTTNCIYFCATIRRTSVVHALTHTTQITSICLFGVRMRVYLLEKHFSIWFFLDCVLLVEYFQIDFVASVLFFSATRCSCRRRRFLIRSFSRFGCYFDADDDTLHL